VDSLSWLQLDGQNINDGTGDIDKPQINELNFEAHLNGNETINFNQGKKT